jgi:uncharacterized membrane-anchored protein
MELGFTKEQLLKVLKVALWVAVSAFLDRLIAETTGSQFGAFTGIINVVLVALRQFVKKS